MKTIEKYTLASRVKFGYSFKSYEYKIHFPPFSQDEFTFVFSKCPISWCRWLIWLFIWLMSCWSCFIVCHTWRSVGVASSLSIPRRLAENTARDTNRRPEGKKQVRLETPDWINLTQNYRSIWNFLQKTWTLFIFLNGWGLVG